MVDHGRSPDLKLSTASGEVAFTELAAERIASMAEIAALLDSAHGGSDYKQAIDLARIRCADSSQTPSGRILTEMADRGEQFWQLALRYSQQWHKEFLSTPLDAENNSLFEQQALASMDAQNQLEANDAVSFESYLENFYQQYRGVQL
jgi:glutamate--cysteine ligase